MDALTLTEAGLLNDVERLRVISHNLANVTTAGFRRDVAVLDRFETHLDAAATRVSTSLDRTQGTLRHTGNALDIALEGEGFFVFQSAAGLLYSRQGTFQVDASGRLTAPGGHAVLGRSGEIVLSGAEPRVDAAGNIWEGDRQVDTLRVVRLAAQAELVSLGSGVYASGDAGAEEMELPGTRQGYVEASNVVPMREMVRLIETMRHFEAGQRLVRSYDEMMDRALGLLGET